MIDQKKIAIWRENTDSNKYSTKKIFKASSFITKHIQKKRTILDCQF